MSYTTNNADEVTFRLAATTSVVVLKINQHYTLLMDPGLGKPWRGQGVFGEKRGDDLAKDAEANGISAKRMSWKEAYRLLLTEVGDAKSLQKLLLDRIIKKQQETSNPTPKRIPLQE